MFNDEKASLNLLWQIEREMGMANFKTMREFIINNQIDKKSLVRIMADCLMPNHFHLLIEEINNNGISRFMHKLGVGYTGYFNKKYERVGGLFQGAFKAVQITDELYLKYLLIYINIINPGQLIEPELKEKGLKNLDKIMKFAENYLWSTNQEYLNKRDSIIIEKGIAGPLFANRDEYQEFARNILLGKKSSQFVNLGRFILE
ncbi:MAG: transposase [Candidatus Nealsonbacteria bacterium]|nr:transposase [Candidatus Nealsonbacteria bacterium]